MYPDELSYTREHEWIRVDGEECTIGITAYAQDELGDVVYVELPAVGAAVTRNDPFGAVESVKAVSDLFAPLTGEVTALNDELDAAPELVNKDPYGAGWMVKIRLNDTDELAALMDAAAYEGLVNELRS